MSEENVELTLRLFDAWNRRDAEAAIALCDPEALWFPALEGITEGRTYRGHDEIRQYYEDLAEFAEESHGEFPEVRDLGNQVLGLGRIWIRFAGGVDLDQELACLYTWRDRRCVEARSWISHAAHAEALEAAGLSE
jgi:ketosteroid isomerase-like protein